MQADTKSQYREPTPKIMRAALGALYRSVRMLFPPADPAVRLTAFGTWGPVKVCVPSVLLGVRELLEGMKVQAEADAKRWIEADARLNQLRAFLEDMKAKAEADTKRWAEADAKLWAFAQRLDLTMQMHASQTRAYFTSIDKTLTTLVRVARRSGEGPSSPASKHGTPMRAPLRKRVRCAFVGTGTTRTPNNRGPKSNRCGGSRVASESRVIGEYESDDSDASLDTTSAAKAGVGAARSLRLVDQGLRYSEVLFQGSCMDSPSGHFPTGTASAHNIPTQASAGDIDLQYVPRWRPTAPEDDEHAMSEEEEQGFLLHVSQVEFRDLTESLCLTKTLHDALTQQVSQIAVAGSDQALMSSIEDASLSQHERDQAHGAFAHPAARLQSTYVMPTMDPAGDPNVYYLGHVRVDNTAMVMEFDGPDDKKGRYAYQEGGSLFIGPLMKGATDTRDWARRGVLSQPLGAAAAGRTQVHVGSSAQASCMSPPPHGQRPLCRDHHAPMKYTNTRNFGPLWTCSVEPFQQVKARVGIGAVTASTADYCCLMYKPNTSRRQFNNTSAFNVNKTPPGIVAILCKSLLPPP